MAFFWVHHLDSAVFVAHQRETRLPGMTESHGEWTCTRSQIVTHSHASELVPGELVLVIKA